MYKVLEGIYHAKIDQNNLSKLQGKKQLELIFSINV